MTLENFKIVKEFVWDVANKSMLDTIKLNQGDANGRKMRVQVVNKGVVEDLTGAQLNLAWVANKGGKGLDAFEVVDATQGLFEITFTTGMLANVGNFRASLQLVLPNGNGIVESSEFKITNYRSNVDSEAAQSTDSWTALETALANASDLESNYTPKLFSLEQQLAQAPKKTETGWANLNTFDESTRAIIQGLEPGEINAVLGDGNVKTPNLGEKVVTPDKTAFVKRSSNLINEKTIIKDKTVNQTTGELIDFSGVSITELIPVRPGGTYTTSVGYSRIAYYDKDMNFIISNQTFGTITIRSDAYYIRVVATTSAFGTYLSLNEGTTVLPYEKYYVEIPDLRFDDGSIKKTVAKGDTEFLTTASKNLYNKNTFTTRKVVTAQGVVQDNEFHGISTMIKVKPLTAYVGKYIAHVAFYDKNKEFISRTVVSDGTVFYSHARAEYVILNVIRGFYNQAQFNQAETLPEYDEYEFKVEGYKVKTAPPLIDDDRYILDGSLDSVFTAPTIPAYPTLATIQTLEVYALYDDLMAQFPDYITRVVEDIGTRHPINCYRFTAQDVGTSTYKYKRPKVIFVSGVHGEKAGIYNLYQAMRQIATNWQNDETLEVLRWNVEFIVAPVINTYGVDVYSRTNENGVNITRNFPPNWVYNPNTSSHDYAGEAPLDQPESQYIDRLLKQHKDAILFTSWHNFSSNEAGFEPKNFIFNLGATHFQTNIARRLISKLSRKWKKEYDWLPQDDTTMFGYSNRESPNGAEALQATYEYGIIGSQFEISQVFKIKPDAVDFDSTSLTLGLETAVNWIAMNVKEIVAFKNSL